MGWLLGRVFFYKLEDIRRGFLAPFWYPEARGFLKKSLGTVLRFSLVPVAPEEKRELSSRAWERKTTQLVRHFLNGDIWWHLTDTWHLTNHKFTLSSLKNPRSNWAVKAQTSKSHRWSSPHKIATSPPESVSEKQLEILITSHQSPSKLTPFCCFNKAHMFFSILVLSERLSRCFGDYETRNHGNRHMSHHFSLGWSLEAGNPWWGASVFQQFLRPAHSIATPEKWDTPSSFLFTKFKGQAPCEWKMYFPYPRSRITPEGPGCGLHESQVSGVPIKIIKQNHHKMMVQPGEITPQKWTE